MSLRSAFIDVMRVARCLASFRDANGREMICLFTNDGRRRSHPVLQCPLRDAIAHSLVK